MRFNLAVPSELTLAFLPDLVLIAGLMALLVWSVWRRESEQHGRSVIAGSIVVCVLTWAATVYASRMDWSAAPGIIAVDNFRWSIDGVILIGAVMTLALMRDYNTRHRLFAGEGAILVLLASSGMMLLAAARDLMIIFLGVELMSVSSYALAGFNRRSARSAEAGLKYFLLGAFSSAFLLYGIALTYGATGSTNLIEISHALRQPGMLNSSMLFVGLALLLVGFAFKVSSVPFHMWTPDVYDGAPTPYAGFMAAAVKAASFAALLRVVLEASVGAVERWHYAVWWLAVATMVVGNLVAVQQRNVKRLLAYSSISHAGFLLVAVAAQTTRAGGAVIFYLLAYTLATVGAFAVVVALSDGTDREINVNEYAGLFAVRPRLAMAMAVFMLALLGFPLAGGMGFFAKWYVLQAALQAPVPQTRLAIILVLMTVVSASFYLYVIMVMFMRSRPEDAPPFPATSRLTDTVILASAVVILILGIYPTPAVRLALSSSIGPVPAAVTTPRPTRSAMAPTTQASTAVANTP